MSETKSENMPASQPVINEIMDRIFNLGEMANKTVDRVYGKLDGVCMSTTPQPEPETGSIEREYPPLFHEMRGKPKFNRRCSAKT
jgi:hypothetical protein